MRLVITENGRTKYFYEKGDVILDTENNLIHEVESVDVSKKEILTKNGDRIILSPKIKPNSKTLDSATIISAKDLKNNKLYFARASKDVKIPTKDEENAGYDIYSYFDEKEFVFNPHETRLVPTGVYSAFSKDYVLIAKERGSTGSVGMKVGAGVIDSGYRGEIFIAITNNNDVPLAISKNNDKTIITDNYILYPYTKAIAQLIVLPVPIMDVEEISLEKLQAIPSKRGHGKLGSSNK